MTPAHVRLAITSRHTGYGKGIREWQGNSYRIASFIRAGKQSARREAVLPYSLTENVQSSCFMACCIGLHCPVHLQVKISPDNLNSISGKSKSDVCPMFMVRY